MKRLSQFLIVMFLLISINSCEKDENNIEKTLEETISAKWNVTGTSDYASFEFNESGNYIVVKNTTKKSTNNEVVHFKTYEITDNNTITLSGFGTIKIIDIDDNTISFSITLDIEPNNEVIINATKQDEIANSSRTKLLCRTWEVVSVDEVEYEDLIVLFSEAGTYFVETPFGNGIGQWNWCDSEETKIAFSVENELNCDGEEIMKEIILTSDSFIGIDMENGEPEVIIMKAVLNL